MSGEGRPRYCLITASYRQPDGANRTGWATYAETMAECLRKDGVQVTVVVTHEPLDTDPALRDRSPDTVHVQLRWVRFASLYLPGIFEGLQLLGAIRRLDAERKFDVIEGPNVAGICWALALWYRRKFLVRVDTSLVSPRGELPGRRTWRNAFKWQLDAFTGRAANTIVTHSLSHAETVAGQYGIRAADIVLIPHAVPDPGPTSPGNPAAFLCIANATRRKGVDVLLAAFARVHAQRPDAELTIVGTTASELTEILAAVPGRSESLAGRIRALGPISDDALDAEWRQAGIVVVPSRYESFGLVAVEAMARSKAVISSDGGALGEVIGESGVVVPAEDADALGRAMIDLLDSPDRRASLGESGRRRYEALYRPEALMERMRELITRRASGSTSSRPR